MFLYLARHGKAASPTQDEPSELTRSGQSETRRMAQLLAVQTIKPQQIWYSPKKRAVQTALLYQEALKLPPDRFIEKETLSIDGDIDSLYEELMSQPDRKLLLVSHQPALEELSSLLVAGSDHFPSVAFPTSGLSLFEYDTQWKWINSWDPSQVK